MTVAVHCGSHVKVNVLRMAFNDADMPQVGKYTVHGHRVYLYADGRGENALIVVGRGGILEVDGKDIHVRRVVGGIRLTGRVH